MLFHTIYSWPTPVNHNPVNRGVPLISYLSRKKALFFLILTLLSSRSLGAGGVIGEAGSCMIKIGFYTAHFTIYQPESSDNKEFCEDLPEIGQTMFVMDYLHDSLREVPVDFRILRDATELGQFTKWADLQAIEDIDAQTVFYQSPTVRPDGALNIEHTFDTPGWYIGVVTAPHPTGPEIYRAVFPFQVAGTFFDFWTVVGLLLLAVPITVFSRRWWAART
jgi:hypothetical protein